VVVAVVWPDTDPAFLTPLRLAGHHVVSVASGERDLRAREVLAVLAAATERLGLVS
jgi:vacuolar-type H+-ATPase subunit F/Vma7